MLPVILHAHWMVVDSKGEVIVVKSEWCMDRVRRWLIDDQYLHGGNQKLLKNAQG